MVRIESWARNGGRLSDLLYSRLRISKVCNCTCGPRSCRGSSASQRGRWREASVITTRTVAPGALPGGREDRGAGVMPGGWPPSPIGRSPSTRPTTVPSASIADGASTTWLNRCPTRAGASDPGRQLGGRSRAHGQLSAGRPRCRHGLYDSTRPLPGANMLLRIRFAGLRLRVGVRIGDVYEERGLGGREARVFGWSYRTLEGHFEQARCITTCGSGWTPGCRVPPQGDLTTCDKGPFLTRTGFRIFGRTQQLRFYRQVCRRTKRLTEAQVETNRATAGER